MAVADGHVICVNKLHQEMQDYSILDLTLLLKVTVEKINDLIATQSFPRPFKRRATFARRCKKTGNVVIKRVKRWDKDTVHQWMKDNWTAVNGTMEV